MKRIVIFLVIVYLVSVVGVWALFSKNTNTNVTISRELETIKNELVDTKTSLDAEKSSKAVLEKKISDASANALFLSLALCPTLEATDKNALCIKNSAEWFSQTIQAGTLITDTETKTKMDAFILSLGGKKSPTAKQFYESLKPIEIESLRTLVEGLK